MGFRSFARALVLAGFAAPFVVSGASADTPASVYHTPPAPIPAMIEATPTPSVSLSRDRKHLAIFGRESLPTIENLSRPLLRLGGYRISPQTNGPAEIRLNWLTSLTFEDVATGATRDAALPKGMRFSAARWSPDDKHVAFIAEAPAGLELWVADADTGQARKLTGAVVNAAFGMRLEWTPDSSAVIVPCVLDSRGAAPVAPTTPDGPIIQENDGHVAPGRTYEDLLKDAHDEALFDYYFTARLTRVSLDGQARAISAPGVFESFSLSPDGRFILTERLHRPYSYNVPARLFPTEIAVLDATDGHPVKILVDRPIADNLPISFDAEVTGPRDVDWRADAPATLVWAEAQDGGDPRKKVDIHDRVVLLDAPFAAPPRTLADLNERFRNIDWGSKDVALLTERWGKTRHETRLVVDPSGAKPARVLLQRNSQDEYNDPGQPLERPGVFGEPVMAMTADGEGVLFAGAGAARDGEHPFLARMDLATGKEDRLWTAEADDYETPQGLLSDDGRKLLTRRESRTDPPNYFVRTVGQAQPRALTHFPDPEPQFAGVTKQLLVYKRADGVNLSGTLYLPAGYDKARDGPLPMLMWAYPTEFTDAKVAGEVIDRSRNRFTRPVGISHLYLLTQGYAIFDGFSAPIIGANGAEPNDTYVEQLVADAKAAVDEVVAQGVADPDRIAVGGHSYGAFMTANLLAHSDLFRAGIARSGAYNRTLTPFGFQNEERTYWQATDVYTKMSPFTFAPQVKSPILLIHGEQDDNDGTFPVQSERFYAALKGAGATVRYVQLPYEPHGYRGRESTLEVLWEMNDWLDRYVKHAPPRAKPAAATKAAP
ncbi:MAG TPA: prolyl oligopeptidase family serine peptidase [Caulobacteraceae bacterium]|jgi:dipeptidyl aminopeptidase/acylaminoacyl peptidase|nr:prolyl oligopeptidase family serine peptidase [Caulobacteraceae bacterium]